jgi:bifunctional enzyme CysN/CysC
MSSNVETGNQSMLRFFTCGSVDDGKSTLIGRLLYESKAVFDDQLSALDRDSRKFGTQGENLDFALLVDGLSAEREQGITIDVAYRYFSTPRRSFIVADTPGHEQYTRNMATGASTADLAVILIDARKGLLPQTRRHSFIVSLLRVRHVVLAINKMDLVGFDHAIFEKIVADYQAIAGRLDFASIMPIPISARDGDNVTQRSDRMGWYQGPVLLDYLESFDVTRATDTQGAMHFPVQWVNRPNLDFRGYAGTLVSGSVKVGDEILVQPSGRRSHIARIVTQDGDLQRADQGLAITLTLRDEVDVSRGDVISLAHAPAKQVQDFQAQLIWMVEQPMMSGREYIIKLASASANAALRTLHHAIDIHTYAPRQALALAMNEIGLVHLSVDKPLVVSDYLENRALGGFILIDKLTNMTAAIGLVDSSAQIMFTAQSETHVPQQRLLEPLNKLWGEVGSLKRHQFWRACSWRVISTLIVYAIAAAYFDSGNIALALALADLIARPLLRAAHHYLWRIWRSHIGHSTDSLDGGAGI